MRRSRHAIVLLLLACGLGRVHAQSAAQFVIWGDNAMAMGDHYGASRFYHEALDQDGGRMELQWKYAEACRLSNQYPQAAEFYEKVQRKDNGRTHKDALRWLGEMQLCSGDYDAASKTWQKVKQHAKDSTSFDARRARNALTGCAMAKRMMADPEQVDIAHLPEPVNSYDSEFGARTGPDSTLYFSSLRGDLDNEGIVQDTGAYHVVVLNARQTAVAWTTPQRLAASINNGQENANCAWSPDHAWFYFTRCDREGRCAIDAAPWNNGAPGEAIELTGLGNGRITTQPMVVGIDGQVRLYYASDATGGEGGMDIWSCAVNGTNVSEAKPLGKVVNTPGNETCPFFDVAQGKLYFSSDFLPGLGGYDNFMCAAEKSGFAPPVNFGYPLNGPANDLYPTFDPVTMSGYFISNRAGSLAKKGETCCNDIYRYSYPHAQPLITKDSATALHPTPEQRITSLREKLPIRLFFHNDEPDPRTWDTLTALDYAQTYDAYKALQQDYQDAWKGNTEAIDAFFRDQVDRGFAQLNDFMKLLRQALDEGQRIELQVRGFASPLAKSDYNKNLSLRRIQSMVNYLRRADHGAFTTYLDGTAANGGRLTIRKSPFGEDKSATGVSDELKDLKGSVYSVGAARERRIEIEQVVLEEERNGENGENGMNGRNGVNGQNGVNGLSGVNGVNEQHGSNGAHDGGQVKGSTETDEVRDAPPTMAQDLGTIAPGKVREAVFTIRNTSDRPLRIISAKPDCSCTTPRLPEGPIAPGDEGEVVVRFNGHASPGPLSRGVTITTDGSPATMRLVITGLVIAHK